jgi:uncharacterized repeat protein (TIGR01451 family)
MKSVTSLFTLDGCAKWLRVWVILGAALLSTLAQAAPSACTAMWGVRADGAGDSEVTYWNGRTWVTAVPKAFPSPAGNAMGGSRNDGTLYFASKVAHPVTMRKVTFDNVLGTMTVSAIAGTVPDASLSNSLTPVTLTWTTTANVSANLTPTNFNYVGATFDTDPSNRRMFLFATTNNLIPPTVPTSQTPSGRLAVVGLLDPENPTAVSWQVLTQSQGPGSTITYPVLAGSGDIFADQQTGQIWILQNLTPQNRLLRVNLTYSGLNLTSAIVQSTASIPALNTVAAGISVDPLSGKVFVSQGNGVNTFELTDHTAASIVATQITTANLQGVGDSGNCVELPDPPSISKAFSTTYVASSPGTTTMTITINNPNKVPIFLNQSVTDTFPPGLGVYAAATTVQCFSNGAGATRPASLTVTAPTVGDTRYVIQEGGMIPGGSTSGGSCSFSLAVSGTVALTGYTNTIPAGSLSTTAGTNTVAATATLQVGTDFSIAKQVRLGTSGPLLGTVSVGGPATLQYALTIVNSASGGTGTATFTDTLPAQISPLLAVTAVTAGGGSCTTTSFQVSSQSRITGTFAGAPPGATCTVTITAKNLRTQPGVFPNTVTLVTGADTADLTATNNNATATASISVTTLTVAKTNGLSTVTFGGTTAYTLTVANLGPANAPNTLLKDPAVTGLQCTSVACSPSAAGASCPAAGSVTIANLQGGGIPLTPSFSVGHSLTFLVTCNVTATGS